MVVSRIPRRRRGLVEKRRQEEEGAETTEDVEFERERKEGRGRRYAAG